MNVIAIRKRIREDASDKQGEILAYEAHYGTPYSFFTYAKEFGLVNDAEYANICNFYARKGTWHYSGD